jgi:hypothetical protein
LRPRSDRGGVELHVIAIVVVSVHNAAAPARRRTGTKGVRACEVLRPRLCNNGKCRRCLHLERRNVQTYKPHLPALASRAASKGDGEHSNAERSRRYGHMARLPPSRACLSCWSFIHLETLQTNSSPGFKRGPLSRDLLSWPFSLFFCLFFKKKEVCGMNY